MDNLLIFFILPLATVIIAIVMERVVRSPISVAAFVFALAIVITFIEYGPAELVYAIIYTIIAYIIAVLTCLIMKLYTCELPEEETTVDNATSEESICDCMRGQDSVNNTNQNTYVVRGRRY